MNFYKRNIYGINTLDCFLEARPYSNRFTCFPFTKLRKWFGGRSFRFNCDSYGRGIMIRKELHGLVRIWFENLRKHEVWA